MKKFIISTLTVVGILCFFSDPQVINPTDWFDDYCKSVLCGCVCLIVARLLWVATKEQ